VYFTVPTVMWIPHWRSYLCTWQQGPVGPMSARHRQI